MARNDVIVRRSAGQDIPVEYLEKVVTECPTAWGVSIVSPEGIQVSAGDNPTVELITGTLKEFKDSDITFYFVNSEAAINMEDVSPHTLVEIDEVPKILAFITGQFPSFEQTASAHPSAFFFVNSYLIPKIRDIYDLVEGDLDKIITQLNKPNFQKEIMLNATGHAAVTFVLENGKDTTLQIAGTAKEFPWGWTSNAFGYGDKTAEVKRTSMIPNKSTVREKAAPEALAAKKTDTSVIVNVTKKMWAPPMSDSRKDKKRKYQVAIGYCPRGYETCPEVEVYVNAEGKMMPIVDVKKLGITAVALPKLNNTTERETDIDPHHIKEEAASRSDSPPAVSNEILPVMSPKTREWMKDIMKREDVKKLIAENAVVVTDPAVVQQLEQKFAEFGKQLGMPDGLKDYMKLDYPWFMKMATERPDGLANFAWSMRNLLASKMAKSAQKLTTTEIHVAAKEELKPETKSMFPKKKVA